MTSCEYLICLTSYLMMDIFFFFCLSNFAIVDGNREGIFVHLCFP